jgi:hypothetical protein
MPVGAKRLGEAATSADIVISTVNVTKLEDLSTENAVTSSKSIGHKVLLGCGMSSLVQAS